MARDEANYAQPQRKLGVIILRRSFLRAPQIVFALVGGIGTLTATRLAFLIVYLADSRSAESLSSLFLRGEHGTDGSSAA